MASNSIESRRERYFRLSSQIAQIDNAELSSLFGSSTSTGGWGRNHTLDIGRSKVFVKRIPVTDLEYENLFSTRNLYDLPTYYNYGVGSAGFGVFRELVTHVKTTNWVLAGEIATFPLTYHYRFIPFQGARADVDMQWHKGYVEYWGGSASIGQYMLDRANANHELILFLEHVPHTLGPWLPNHPGKLDRFLEELRVTIDFLRKQGVIHFDAHLWNILTDGEQAYLTDFGLVLDKSFALTQEEQSFFRRHIDYDYGEVLSCLDFLLLKAYDALPEAPKREMQQAYGIKEKPSHHELAPLLVDNIEAIYKRGILRLNDAYVQTVIKYRPILTLMGRFFSSMQTNNSKDAKFPHARLRRLLKETGFLSDTRADR